MSSLLQRLYNFFGTKPAQATSSPEVSPEISPDVSLPTPILAPPAGAVFNAIDIYTLMTSEKARADWTALGAELLTHYLGTREQAAITRAFHHFNDDFKPSVDRLVCIFGQGRFHIGHETHCGVVLTGDGPKDNFLCLASIDGAFQNGKAYAKTTILTQNMGGTATVDTTPGHIEAMKHLRAQAELHPLEPVHYEQPLGTAQRKPHAYSV